MIDPGEFSSVSLATASSPRFGGYLHRRRRAGADFLASLCQHPLLFAIALQIVLIVRSARRRRLLALDIFVVVAMLLGPFQPQLAEIRTPPRAVAAGRAAPVPYSRSPMGNSSATTRHVGGLTAQGKQVDDSHQRPNRENRSVSFEPNRGQTDPSVRFKTSGLGGNLYFTSTGFVGVFRAGANSAKTQTSVAEDRFNLAGSRGASGDGTAPQAGLDTSPSDAPKVELGESIVRMQFLGSNPDPRVEAGPLLTAKVNYLLGNDPSRWVTNLPTYSAITYSDLYAGIDLSYDGTDGLMKGTYSVSPGTDPSIIRWRYAGAQQVSVDVDGNLHVSMPPAEAGVDRSHNALASVPVSITEEAPIAWQYILRERVPVSVRYKLWDDGSVGFEVGSYNRNGALIIDPTLRFSTFLGGYDEDYGCAVTVHGGSPYIAGITRSTNFPTRDPHWNQNSGGFDIFLTKMNANGTDLIYSTYLGGSGDDWSLLNADDCKLGLAVDSSGNVYLAGQTSSSTFPVQNAIQGTLSGSSDAFITKLNAAGSALEFSTYLGGSASDGAESLAVDDARNVYVTGSTTSSEFPVQNALYANRRGPSDAFVTKLNAAGSVLVYSTYLGGHGDNEPYNGSDYGHSIKVDSAGAAYIGGETYSNIDFPLQNAFQSTYGGATGADGFVTKFNADGSALVFSTYLGGEDEDYVFGLALDDAGRAHVTGVTHSLLFPVHNAIQSSFGGPPSDAFITKFEPSGSAVEYSTFLGGYGGDTGDAIALDPAGDVHVSGGTWSDDFPVVNAAELQPQLAGYIDAFVAKLNAAGTAWIYSTYWGGTDDNDRGESIAAESIGNAYVTGFTFSPDFTTTLGVFQPQMSLSGTLHSDAFLVKIYDPEGAISVYPESDELMGAGSPSQHPTTCTVCLVNAVTGNFWETFADVFVPERGLPMQFVRTYNSLMATSGGSMTPTGQEIPAENQALGSGWTHNYNMWIDQDGGGNYLVHEENGSVARFDENLQPPRRVMATLTNSNGTYIFARTHGQERYFFEPVSGTLRLTQIEDRNGSITTLGYEGSLLKTVTDAVGRSLTFTYTAGGLLDMIGDPIGRTLAFTYTNGNLMQSSDLGGRVTQYAYDAGNRLETITDPQSRTLTNEYDAVGRVISQTDYLNNAREFEYLANGTRLTVDSLNLVSDFGHSNNMLGGQDLTYGGLHAGWDYDYQPDTSWLQSATDPNGHQQGFTWDLKGNVKSITDALTRTTHYTYTTQVLPTGGEFELLTETRDALQRPTSLLYNELGQVTVITDALTQTLRFEYDTLGRLSRTLDQADVPTCREYDSQDNLTAIVQNCRPNEPVTASQNVRTEFGYDGVGRRIWGRNALGEVTRTFYRIDDSIEKVVVGCTLNGAPSTTDCDAVNVDTPHLNRTTLYAYDTYGRPTLVTDTLGIMTYVDYDTHGRTWHTVQNYVPGGAVDAKTNVTTTTEYDSIGRVSGTVDALGRRTVVQYDDLSRVTARIGNYVDGNPSTGTPDSDLVTRYEYDPVGNPVTTTVNYVDGAWDPLHPDEDVKTVTLYDELDRPRATIESYVDGVGSPGEVDTDRITEYQYDEVGNLVATMDPLGRVNVTVFDELNRAAETITNCTDGNGQPRTTDCATGHGTGNDENIRSAMAYTSRSELETLTDPIGRLTRNIYDPLGRLSQHIQNYNGGVTPPNVTTKYGYDALGHTLVMTDALTGTVRYQYNIAGWLEHQYDQTNVPANFQYDGLGRSVIQSDALGREAHTLYDPLGRPFKQVVNWQNGVPDLNDPPDVDLVTETVYDRASRQVAQIAQDGKRTNYVLDGLDRLTSVVENADGLTLPANVTTTYTYDRRGLLKTITDALSRPPRVVSYNAAGWMISSTDPLSRTTSYTYDRAGRQRTVADPRPAVITYTYDLLDRTTGITGPVLTPIAFGYDIGSRRTSMIDATGTTGYTYDGLDRVIQAAHSADGTVNIGYDPLGRRTGLSTNNGMPPLTYSYDAAGRLGEVKKSGVTYASAITDTVGRLQSISRVNGATTTYTYDGADRVTRLRTAVGANTRGDFNYNLSRGSQVTAVTETLGLGTRNVTYGYDGLRRLVSAATSTGSTPPQTYGYEYDLVGNRRSVTVNGKKVEQHTYDAADQVVGWTYDGAGNLLQDGSNTYTYDALKRLAQVDKTPGQTYIYTYNGDNVLEREQRTGPFNWIITYFTLDTAGGLPERLGARVNNGTTSWYMRGWGQELSRENFQGQANTVSWYLPDRLGSVRGEMDDAGGLSTTYNYDPFGTPEGSTSPQDYGFTGEPQTASLGLVHLRARWYSTGGGTLLSRDPFSGWTRVPSSLHPYMYVFNDPVNGRDPTGFSCIGADILDPECAPTPGIDPDDDVWDFLFGIAAAWTDDNTFYVHPDAKQPVVAQPDDSAATTVGRYVGHLLAMAQGLAEFGAGAGGIAAGGVLCLTGVGCVVGSAAMVASSALAAHGAAVCTSTAIHAGTELGQVAFSSGSGTRTGSGPQSRIKGRGYGKTADPTHYLDLGRDPDRGNWVSLSEVKTANRLEEKIGKPLARIQKSDSKAGDWLDPETNTSYDAVAPIDQHFPTQWNRKNIQTSIDDHLTNTALDYLVVDLTDLSPSQAAQVDGYIAGLTRAQRDKIIRIP